MTRSTKEWRGKTDDEKVPDRVRVRVFGRDDGRCTCGCDRKIMPGDAWQTDHTIALINGGENRERNLTTLLTACHLRKTIDDVAEKSAVATKRKKHLGLRKAKGRPMIGTKASGWKHTFNNGWVRR